MRVLAFPIRLDGAGSLATVEQWSDAQAQQTGLHIVSTYPGERRLAPLFGLDGLIDDGLTDDEVLAAVDLCEPDLEVTDLAISTQDYRQQVTLTVRWRDDDDLGDV